MAATALLFSAIEIAGLSYALTPALLPLLAEGTPLRLEREPTNAYDERAVAVFLVDGPRIGYLPRRVNAQVAALLDAGDSIAGEILSIGQHTRETRLIGDGRLYAQRIKLAPLPDDPDDGTPRARVTRIDALMRVWRVGDGEEAAPPRWDVIPDQPDWQRLTRRFPLNAEDCLDPNPLWTLLPGTLLPMCELPPTVDVPSPSLAIATPDGTPLVRLESPLAEAIAAVLAEDRAVIAVVLAAGAPPTQMPSVMLEIWAARAGANPALPDRARALRSGPVDPRTAEEAAPRHRAEPMEPRLPHLPIVAARPKDAPFWVRVTSGTARIGCPQGTWEATVVRRGEPCHWYRQQIALIKFDRVSALGQPAPELRLVDLTALGEHWSPAATAFDALAASASAVVTIDWPDGRFDRTQVLADLACRARNAGRVRLRGKPTTTPPNPLGATLSQALNQMGIPWLTPDPSLGQWRDDEEGHLHIFFDPDHEREPWRDEREMNYSPGVEPPLPALLIPLTDRRLTRTIRTCGFAGPLLLPESVRHLTRGDTVMLYEPPPIDAVRTIGRLADGAHIDGGPFLWLTVDERTVLPQPIPRGALPLSALRRPRLIAEPDESAEMTLADLAALPFEAWPWR